MTRRRLLVEGWRFIAHSYALVTQAHCLALLRRDDVELRFRDIPFHDARWHRTAGLLSPDDDRLMATLPSPDESFVPDVTLHMVPDFRPPEQGRKVTFGTPEFRVIPIEWRGDLESGREVDPNVEVLTPSRWTATAYERFGLPTERIHVVPHGVDPRLLRPDPAARAVARARLGVSQGAFLFMNVGAMTENKGIGILLRAFARVVETHPQVRLLLKGGDDLYPSKALLDGKLSELDAAERERAGERLLYMGQTLSASDMAQVLRAADCYVAPYLAEGFNMPVLEAAACGVPVICTAGGSTDDFTDASFALRIDSRPVHVRVGGTQLGDALMPDVDHLVTLMRQMADDPARAAAMGAAASLAAHAFSWDAVTQRLMTSLFRTP